MEEHTDRFMLFGDRSFSRSLTERVQDSGQQSVSSSQAWSSRVLAHVPMSQGGIMPPNSEGRISGTISWCRLFRLFPCIKIWIVNTSRKQTVNTLPIGLLSKFYNSFDLGTNLISFSSPLHNPLLLFTHPFTHPFSCFVLQEGSDDRVQSVDVPRLVDKMDASKPGWEAVLYGAEYRNDYFFNFAVQSRVITHNEHLYVQMMI